METAATESGAGVVRACVLASATAAEIIASAIFAVLFSRVKRVACALHRVQAPASALPVFGVVQRRGSSIWRRSTGLRAPVPRLSACPSADRHTVRF